MKLYKITQDVYNSWDTYDSAVVCADNEEEARNIPVGDYKREEWAKPEDVKVQYLGEAAEGIEKGIVLLSFNAG